MQLNILLVITIINFADSYKEAERINNGKRIVDDFVKLSPVKLKLNEYSEAPNVAGLYLFVYEDFPNVHPLYIGMTKNLERRFSEHNSKFSTSSFVYNWEVCVGREGRTRPSFSIGSKILDIGDLENVKIMYIAMLYVNAKWLESMFLQSFDFAFNQQENDRTRCDLQTADGGTLISIKTNAENTVNQLKSLVDKL